MNTIDDLSLDNREKHAVIEASKMLREIFPVKKPSFLDRKRTAMMMQNLILISLF